MKPHTFPVVGPEGVSWWVCIPPPTEPATRRVVLGPYPTEAAAIEAATEADP